MGIAAARCCENASDEKNDAADTERLGDPRSEEQVQSATMAAPIASASAFSTPPTTETGAEKKVVASAPYKRAFTLERKDNSMPLGVGLNSCARGSGDKQKMHLYVQNVKKGGFVEKWNNENPSLQILEGDLIVKVNEIEGQPAKMVEELKGNLSVELHVERYQEKEAPSP